MSGASTRYAVAILSAALFVLSCPHEDGDEYELNWELEPCTEEDQALIDLSVERAQLIESYMEQAIDDEFEDGRLSYGQILRRLEEIHGAGNIRCGRYRGETVGDVCGMASHEENALFIGVDCPVWEESRAAWSMRRDHGETTREELAERIAIQDAAAFFALKEEAYLFELAPAFTTAILVHETAHLETPDCCHHGAGEIPDDPPYADFVVDLQWHTINGVYWEWWIPEARWLNETYIETHPE